MNIIQHHHQQNKCYPQRCLLANLKVHSILAVANLIAHNNMNQICYCGQILLQSAAVKCSFSDNLAPMGVTFILLAVVPFLDINKRGCPRVIRATNSVLLLICNVEWNIRIHCLLHIMNGRGRELRHEYFLNIK